MESREQEKKDKLLAALDLGMVMIHLDARRPGVSVPDSLKEEAHLRLNLSYRFDPPDLSVTAWGIRCTLTFGGKRHPVAVPWSALFALTSYVSREFWMFPDDMPPEILHTISKKDSGEGPDLEAGAEAFEPPPPMPVTKKPARPVLQQVKGGLHDDDLPESSASEVTDPATPVADGEGVPPEPPEPPRPSRSHLRLLK